MLNYSHDGMMFVFVQPEQAVPPRQDQEWHWLGIGKQCSHEQQ